MKKSIKKSENELEGLAHQQGTVSFWSSRQPKRRLHINIHSISSEDKKDDKSSEQKEYRQTMPNLLSDGDIVIVSNFKMTPNN